MRRLTPIPVPLASEVMGFDELRNGGRAHPALEDPIPRHPCGGRGQRLLSWTPLDGEHGDWGGSHCLKEVGEMSALLLGRVCSFDKGGCGVTGHVRRIVARK